MAAVHPLQVWLEEPDKNRTQAALAEEAGVTQSFVSRLIRGERNCDPDTAERIARATRDEVSVNDLIFFWRHQRRSSRPRRSRAA
jgi:DNA-binding transcriptional regulator YdaS (Cro superfamily)